MENSKSFQKTERLCSKKAIADLFTEGKSFHFYPLKVVFKENNLKSETTTNRVLITVSKKKFKLAVDRNRIKRLIREAWRQHKHIVDQQLSSKPVHLDIALIFTGHQIPDFKLIQKKINAIVKRLIQHYEVAD